MGRKTKRYGILKRLVKKALEEMTKGYEFTARQLANKLEPEFEAPITPQAVGWILRECCTSNTLTYYKQKSKVKMWIKQ